VVIDSGSGIRNLGRELARTKGLGPVHLLLTHAHWDHLQGFPFFLPAYLKGCSIHVWGGPRRAAELRGFLKHQLEPPFFPVKFEDLAASFHFARQPRPQLELGGTRIQAIPLSHPDGGYGFKFSEAGKSFVFLTDNELGFRHPGGLPAAGYAELCTGADLLLHDAQYSDEEYRHTRGWGHSTFAAAAGLAGAAQVRRFGIIHHDPQHSDEQLDRWFLGCRRSLARPARGRSSPAVECFGALEGMEITV